MNWLKDRVRIYLKDSSVLDLPRDVVAMSLVNDWPYDGIGDTKTIHVRNAFSNGDDVEITVKRIPK